jgi:hypothetical protein
VEPLERGGEVEREVEQPATSLAPLPDLHIRLEMDPPVERREPEAVVQRIDHPGRDLLQGTRHRRYERSLPPPQQGAEGEDPVG